MTVLIVEGPDLSGKTFAIEKIGKFFNNGYTLKNNYKPRQAKDDAIYARYWHILDMIDEDIKTDTIVILDRFYPSQAVYSYMRGVDEFDSDDIAVLEGICHVSKVLYVYLDTDIGELEKRYVQRGDEHISIKDLKIIKERYDEFYDKTILNKVKIDTRKGNWLETLKKTIEGLQ